MAASYRVISADSHLEVPPEHWTKFVSERFRERAPRRVKLSSGGDAFLVEGSPPICAGLNVVGGKSYDEFSPVAVRYEDSAGTGSGEQRVAEMQRDGVDAEVLFPGLTGPFSCRSIRDDAVYRAMIRAYNDWLAEEYCAAAPHRLLAMGCIPETGIDDAVDELEHCAKIGLKGVVLNQFPSGAGYPTPADDRFWAVAVEMRIPVTVHVSTQFGRSGDGGPAFQYGRQLADVGPPGPDVVRNLASYGLRGALNAVQLTMARVFERFPSFHIYFAENEAGWIPMFLQELDNRYRRHRGWIARLYELEPLDRLPSEYIREHCYWGFLRDPFGVRVRDEIGVDRLMWGSDFPHFNGDWPNSRQVLETNFGAVPAEERYRMTAGNAVDFFHLEVE